MTIRDTLLTRIAIGAIAVTIGAQIVYPLVHGSARDAVTMLVLCAGAIAMGADALDRRGLLPGASIIVSVGVIAFIAEVAGTRTGIPFGEYSYAQDRIGPSIADVPVLITAAWFVGAYAVWRVASFVAPRHAVPRLLGATVALVGWDLYLDPQMVAAGLWRWGDTDAGLPGIEQIPLTNYAGWTVLGLVVFGLLTVIDPPPASVRPDGPRRWPADRPRIPMVATVWFAWTWLGSAVAQIWFLEGGELRTGIPYAFAAMGVLGVPGIAIATRCRRQGHRPGTMTTCWE